VQVVLQVIARSLNYRFIIDYLCKIGHEVRCVDVQSLYKGRFELVESSVHVPG